MRIIERYPWYYRLLRGEGGWAFFTPLRYFVSLLYGLYVRKKAGTFQTTPSGDGSAYRRQRDGASTADKRSFIVTIGNIEAGGLGKTPVTLEIAGRLVSHGNRVVVVTRGYRSLAENSDKSVILFPEGAMDPMESGEWLDARSMLREFISDGGSSSRGMSAIAGDEAVLYSERGIPVVIDKTRSRGIETALNIFSPSHILLDDAYQRVDVRADMTILLLDAERPFGNGHLLPMGTLREQSSSVARADIVIFTRHTSSDLLAKRYNQLKHKDIYYSKHVGAGLFERNGTRVQQSVLEGREFILFSGIARPESFEKTVIQSGLEPFLSFRFIDHHAYSDRDIDDLLENTPDGAVYITTEKDIGKVRGRFPEDKRLLYLKLSVEIEQLDVLIAGMRQDG